MSGILWGLKSWGIEPLQDQKTLGLKHLGENLKSQGVQNLGGLKLESSTYLHPELLGPVVLHNHSLQPTVGIPLLDRWPCRSCLNTSDGELTAEDHGRERAAWSATTAVPGREVVARAAFLPGGGGCTPWVYSLLAWCCCQPASRKDSDFQRKCILILLSAFCGLSQPSSSLLSLQHGGFGGHCYLRKAKATSKAGLGYEGEQGSSKGFETGAGYP